LWSSPTSHPHAGPSAASRVVGTDVFHATILLGVTGLAQLGYGNVDLWMVDSLLIGSVPGVSVGSDLTVRAPTRACAASSPPSSC